MTFDLIIKNGTVIDGAAVEPYLSDIGISGSEIKAIGNLSGAKAAKIIPADGMYVTPGFVDVQNHSDSYLTIMELPTQDSMITQGITTIAMGHCGTSLAPLASPEALKSIQKWHSLAGINLNWLTFAEYLTALENHPLGVNALSLAGHATLRRGLIRDEIRVATKEEIKIIEKLLSDSLDAGAAGLSLGLVYAHEVNSSADELESVTRLVAQKNKLLSVHLRSEGSHVIESLDEALQLAQKNNCALKISHFKIRGTKNYPFLEQALGAMDRAYQKGLNISFDVYPYTTSWTVLYTYLPKWAYEGGRAGILKNIKDPSSRAKIISYLKTQEMSLGSIFIATSETNPGLVGKTLSQVAANQEVTVEEALLNVLEATNAQVVVFDRNLSEEILETLLKHPLSLVGTDGAGYDFGFTPTRGLVHPRCFGTMPRFLSMVRDKKLMSWSDAIKKITVKPAEKLRLYRRGKIAVDYFADLMVFNPATIGSKATYENPYQQSDGISHVVVNGREVFSDRGEMSAEGAGSVLRV